MLPEQAPDAGCIDADAAQRLVERVLQNRVLLRYRASGCLAVEVLAFVEHDDVGAFPTLENEFPGVGLSPAERDDLVVKQFFDTGEKVKLSLAERPSRREPQP